MQSADKHQPRVFVLALDGATFDLIGPWIRAGHLPSLQELINSGAHGELESTYPPLTGPAWSTFMTGKLPANHGVLEFFRRTPTEYEQILNSRRDIDGRSIWRVLSNAGKKVAVQGVPITFPPEAVNGFLVTGLLTPRQPGVTFTHPPELEEELVKELGVYILHRTETYSSNVARLIKEENAILDNHVEATVYLMQNKPWDFFVQHILGTDVLQHRLWQYLDPAHPNHDAGLAALHGNPVLDFWKAVDRRLGDVLDRLPPDAYFMVISDHGFGPVEKFINFNVWLLRMGYLKLKRDVPSRLRQLAFRAGLTYAAAVRAFSRSGLIQRVHRLGRGKREGLQRKLFMSFDDVDWSRTRVFSMGNFGQLYVNLKGRESQGCVAPGNEYHRLIQQLEHDLRDLRDPETGEPAVSEIWRGEELFQGKYADRAPDLFFFTSDMKYKAMGLSDFGSNRVFDDLYGTYAHHRTNGLLILRGPGVREGEWIEGARLVDLAPTIYALMEVPIPLDLDGRVLHQVFASDFSVTPQYESGERDHATEAFGGAVYSAEEEATIVEQLRGMGYVD